MKSDVFNVELNKIEDENIKESTKYILNKLIWKEDQLKMKIIS